MRRVYFIVLLILINYCLADNKYYTYDALISTLEAWQDTFGCTDCRHPGYIYQDNDLGQGTGGQPLNDHSGPGADENTVAELHLFNPASTTYVKHFYSRSNNYHASDISVDAFVGGYANTTSAVNAVQFAPASGDFDGKIKMWGVK